MVSFKHLAIALALLGLAAGSARAADSLESENTGTTASTSDTVVSKDPTQSLPADGGHSYHNRTYASYFHGEVPIKSDAGAYYYEGRIAPLKTSCTHDNGKPGSNHGGDRGSNGQGQGYYTGYMTGCPDYTGDNLLQQGTWTNEPLGPAVWEQRVWKSDARDTGAYSDGYVKDMTSYVSNGMSGTQPAGRH